MHAFLDELSKSALPHHQALEVLTAKALAACDYLTAFMLADRRCRIEPPPLAHCYVLRADASRSLGDCDAAVADLFEALRIAPLDLAALRRLFVWGTFEQRRSAAMSLISVETDVRLLRDAVKLLFANGGRHHANLLSFDQSIRGWVAWEAGDEVELSIASSDHRLASVLTADPFHALATEDFKAVSFTMPRPASSSPQMVSLARGGRSFFSKRLAPNVASSDASPSQPECAPQNELAQPTLIIPVYDDFAATKACLDSVLADSGCGSEFRVVLIDDASPDAAITQYLQSLSHLPFVELIVNDVNLGFIGSINRALATLQNGDVLLLNADTIVPPGFVGRLQQAAHSASDIGTVVPLSNNSSICDFPLPYQANPLGSYADVVELDRLAQCANRNLVVDLPNGTGFCLYITCACIHAVGHLAEIFERGYLEDIDFCLRAREKGFRSVCAPNIYVGHAGSRSFGDTKRALVLKNLAILDHRFPSFRAETASFMKADPLRAARLNIERLCPALAAEQHENRAIETEPPRAQQIGHEAAERGEVLAVIPALSSASEFTLLRRLATACFKSSPQLDIVVAGPTFDDRRLMSHPNLFVSGSIGAHELDHVLSSIRAGRILFLGDADTSHLSLASAQAMGLPVAYFDRSAGALSVRPGDLAISLDLPEAQMIEAIGAWVMGA